MQADAAELYLCSNCPLKMNFQGHEIKVSDTASVKNTDQLEPVDVVNMTQSVDKTTRLSRLYSHLSHFSAITSIHGYASAFP
jgi:hypothetical protein